MNRLPSKVRAAFEESEREQLEAMAWNPWFVNSYWPANRPRLLEMLTNAALACPPGPGVTLLDVGCGSGYMCHVFATAGYEVTGVDVYEDKDRERLFKSAGIAYADANFNTPDPLVDLRSDGFDLVVCGEVVEHILFHPQGFVDELFRLTKSGGHAIITTPNPCTVMNAARMLRGRYSLWGTNEFASSPKFENGQVISRGDIHYREYHTEELQEMVRKSGYEIVRHTYLGSGAYPLDGLGKRLLKRVGIAGLMMRTRLFGACHSILAKKAT